jgi:peptidoglycan/LPS O-acetylase OafA/YrhL
MRSRRKPIPSLTGVRGVAAIWVFMTHIFGFAAIVWHAPALRGFSFFTNGFRGVDLFFILSGFILMHVHADDFTSFHARTLQAFFVTRFFRIYPLNTVVLLAMVPLVLLAPSYVAGARAFSDPHFAYRAQNLSFPGFIQNLLLAQSWTVAKLGEWNIVSWTLSAEVLGYALFPALCWLVLREKSWARCAAFGCASLAVLTVLLFASHHANNNPTGTFGAVRMFFCFTAGICLYRCYQLAPASVEAAASGLTCLALLFIAATMFVHTAPVLDAFGFAALIFGLAYQRGPVNALLESRLAVFFGKLSFSFYLVHFLIIGIISWSLEHWLAAQAFGLRIVSVFVIFALCLLAAGVLYELVERPAQRLGRRLVQGLPSGAGRPIANAAPLPSAEG